MNPSYMASMKATSTMILNAFLGIPHKPKAEKETSINGRAFAPGKGVQQEVSSEEKEAKVQAHLDKLAKEAKARYLYDTSKYPEIFEVKNAALVKEEIEDRNENPSKVMTALYGADNACKIDETSTHEQVLKALHEDHAAYITRQIALNRTNYRETGIDTVVSKRNMSGADIDEPKYPTSDLIDALHEHIAELDAQTAMTDRIKAVQNRFADAQDRREAARKAAIHTGERVDLGTKFEAQ